MGCLPLMLLLASLLALGSTCTVPYVAVGEQCLLFLSTLTLDHQGSADICASLNGKAAIIDEPDQLRNIVEYVNGDVTLQTAYWIDGEEGQGEWLYSNGAAIPMGTPFWATYYENATGYGQQPIDNNLGGCLALSPEKHYYFYSERCDDKMSPICEELPGTAHSVGNAVSSSCGGSIASFSGVITSPNYPSTYPVPSDCIWTITRGVDSVIRITVTDVDIYCPGGTESGNYLSIRDGSDINSPELGHYYCHNIPTPIDLVTSGNQAWVSFQAPSNGHGYKGFSLSYTTGCKSEAEDSCHFTYSSPTGSFNSPCYPVQYPSNLDCTWEISVDVGHYIVLTVVTFDIEDEKDIVQIRDGGLDNDTVIAELTGTLESGYDITSTNNKILLSFKSDDSAAYGAGFAFVWASKELCPAPYLNVGRMCLHIVLYDLTHGMSSIACEEAQGELATINNSQDLRDLYVFLHNQGIADYSFWLGASDENEEGVWKWNDNSMVPRGTPFWGTVGSLSEVQEPDGGESENCLMLIADGMHFFRDARCDEKVPAICMVKT